MTGQRWRDLEELFHRALESEPSARSGFLASACGDDAVLREEVEALLQAFETSETERLQSRPAPEETLRIGPYAVQRKIGEGGMGTVYLGERHDDQFVKTVAIKVIRTGPGSHTLVQRFYTERQILAGMEHPNIARLIDGGITEDGQPYLVMDYIDGVRLDAYCDDHRLGIRRRLELFRKVCAAVKYAHQALVVHRDLKPNNILVPEDGEPKLLDFGVAKVLQESQQPGKDQTVTGGMFFTPLYTSPEGLQGIRTTVAADIYALGVILYELITGHRPFENLIEQPAELIRAVISVDPPRPSDSLSLPPPGEASAEELASRRGESPDKLKRLLRGDLDGIALRAVARLPEERYGSVEELSADIASYLEGRPVRARPQTIRYKAGKFLRRNRSWLGAAAAAVVLLSSVGGYAILQQVQAAQRFEETRAIAKYLLFDLFDELSRLPGSTGIRAKMAQQAQAQLDQLSAVARSNRAVRLEAASGYNRLAEVYGVPGRANLGDPEAAVRSLKRARLLLDELCTAEPANRDAGIERARNSLLHSKIAMWLNGQSAAAAVLISEAERELERVYAGGDAKWLRTRAMLRVNQAEVADFQERWADENKAVRDGLAEIGRWPATLQPDESDAVTRTQLLRQGGNALFYTGHPADALEQYRAARTTAKDADARWPNRPGVLSALMVIGYDIGTTLDKLGHPPAETIVAFREAAEVGQRLLAIDDRDENLRRSYLLLRQASAEVLAQAGRHAEAFEEQETVVRARSAAEAAHPGLTRPARDLAFSIMVLGNLHWSNRDPGEACRLWQSALARFETLHKSGGLTEWDRDQNVAVVRDHLKHCAPR